MSGTTETTGTAPAPSGRLARLRSAPYAVLALGAFLAAAYLCLVNLDYAALWHDEAPAALIGKNLLEQGSVTGWDGRNLAGGTNGRTLNAQMQDVLPPLMYALNAAGFALFGVNETGARIMHALIGILALALLYLLLRRHIANQPRLVFFLFLFAAWSPQLLLYFRQSRYYAFMVLGVIAGFYLYERYWQSRNAVWIALLTPVLALSFFNHYTGGAATMLTLAAWHLLFRVRETARRDWLLFAASGAVAGALGLAYLAYMGVVGGERSGFGAYTGVVGGAGHEATLSLYLWRIWIYIRDTFAADWVSWPVFIWFAGMLVLAWQKRRAPRRKIPRRAARKGKRKQSAAGTVQAAGTGAPAVFAGLPFAAVGQLVLMGALFVLISGALSVQPVDFNSLSDLRYFMGALPLLLAMKGLFVEWLWRKSAVAGAAALAVLLFTSAGAAPFNIPSRHSGEPTLGAHLFQFVREVHRPYRDSIRVTSDYLLAHAGQDDLVYVPGFADREALMFYTGGRVKFCCQLDRNSPLPRAAVEALNAPLYLGEHTPDWIVVFGPLRPQFWDSVKAQYAVAERLDVYFYPTQRPEIDFRAFAPLPPRHGVTVLHKRKQ